MILKKEILQKSELWHVPPDTVDKDYVIGHLLCALNSILGDQLIFKGGTCLRKCHFPEYRFSEDLDFSSRKKDFELDQLTLNKVCAELMHRTGIVAKSEKIGLLLHHDIKKGYQVKIKYWGANHRRNQEPPPVERWTTAIKLEISTDEVILLRADKLRIMHPFSDFLYESKSVACYSLKEIISEKLRALVQRAYTAPRDYFDLYYLTKQYQEEEWAEMKPLFLKKMQHKDIQYTGPSQLVNPTSIEKVKKAWKASLGNLPQPNSESMDEVISFVETSIHKYLPGPTES
jgi:predicted nucleotidyltransferase component of viral defense system